MKYNFCSNIFKRIRKKSTPSTLGHGMAQASELRRGWKSYSTRWGGRETGSWRGIGHFKYSNLRPPLSEESTRTEKRDRKIENFHRVESHGKSNLNELPGHLDFSDALVALASSVPVPSAKLALPLTGNGNSSTPGGGEGFKVLFYCV